MQESMTQGPQTTNRLPRYEDGQPVSVVLICRNKADCLPHVLRALATGTRRPDLVVLSDEASTDGSRETFAGECKAHGLRQKIVVHADTPPYKINTLRNDGVDACEEGLIILLDADHVPARTAVEAHIDMHLRHKEGVLSTGPRFEYAYPDCDGPINFKWGHEWFTMMQPRANEPLPTWATVLVSNTGVTKSAVAQLGRFDPDFDGMRGFNDVDFTYRAWKAGYFFAGSFEAHAIHIPHATNPRVDVAGSKELLEKKHGFKFSYPGIVNMIARTSWYDYYQLLIRQNRAMRKEDPMSADWDAIIEENSLDVFSGKFLLRVALHRFWQKLRGKAK